MQYRGIDRTDLRVSAIAMGCWAIADESLWGAQDESDAVAAIHASLEAGINFFDTAPAYGQGKSETLLAGALGNKRDQVVIATKVGGSLTPQRVRSECEASLRRLNTDRIDLYQIHWPDHRTAIDQTLAEMHRLKDEGKIRAIGVCNFGPVDLAALPAHETPVVNQVAYNLLTRAVEFEVAPECRKRRIGILAYSPLAQGLLTGKFAGADDVPLARARSRHFSSRRAMTRHGEPGCEEQTFSALAEIRRIAEGLGVTMGVLSLAWCLHRGGVVSVLSGIRNREQARANAAAAALRLDESTLAELDRATDPVKQALGRHLDLWEGAGTGRVR